MSGVLYIVATPIGNLDDLSLRAIATLKAVELVAAEDTRHSRQLLRHHGIDTPLLSCHEHNEVARSREILDRLEAGGDVALISDAGTPLISDPGYRLVRAARERGLEVSPIPGASSVMAALSAAGLPTESFHFAGFLAPKAAQRAARLRRLRDVGATLVLFESGRRIESLLAQVSEIFPRRRCVVAKELTKLHERFLEGSADELRARFAADDSLRRGEFVVLIDNPADESAPDADDARLLGILLDELSVKMAVKIAMRLTGKKKNELYTLALGLRQNAASEPAKPG